jgi:signal transduction histidine kinase
VLRIEAGIRDGALELRVTDNGRGFAAGRTPRALDERARAIGVRLAVESRPGRTVVQIGFGA